MIVVIAFLVLAAAVFVVEFGSFRSLQAWRVPVVASVVGLVGADTLAHWIVVHKHVGEGAAIALSVVLVTLAIAAVPVGALVALSWFLSRVGAFSFRSPRVRGATAAGPKPERAGEATEMKDLTRRQVVEGVGGAAILAATGTTLAWGALRGRFEFLLEEVPVRIPGLPRALDGYVIAQVSDIHGGIDVGEHTLDAGLAVVRRAKADLLVVTGDLVDYNPAYAPFVARKLADVAPSDGCVVILGNHDHYAGPQAVLAAMRAAGLTTLVNENRIVRPADGGGFALLGVEDLFARRGANRGPDLDRALVGVPVHLPRILLSHQPRTVNEFAGHVTLQLSGHTHGGQINPGVRPADLLYEYVAGMYPVRGTRLYVNRGFGTVGPPARVGAPPEVTRFVLVAA